MQGIYLDCNTLKAILINENLFLHAQLIRNPVKLMMMNQTYVLPNTIEEKLSS